MKLHLNLALRRALIAAMSMVALHTAEADLTTKYNGSNAYLTGNGTLTSNQWNDIWNKHKSGTLTIGTYQGAAVVELGGSTYNKGNDIYLGGVGYDSNTSVANNGELIVNQQTKLNVNVLNVGNSQVGGTGTLTVNGGAVTAGTALYVGVNAGSGIVNVTDGGSITIASGKNGATFAMSHRNIAGLTDTVTLNGSTITVGAKGGVTDYTSIGHSSGIATLNLEAGSTANFYDQLLVGEKGGSNGTIHVHGSTLNMGTTTVLGAAAGATGIICIEDGTAKGADALVIGSKGNGTIEMLGDKASLAANSIELGDAAGSKGTINAQGGSITTDLLTIGTSGTGSVVSAAIIKATDIVIGKDVTGSGSLVSQGSVETDNLYVGYKGTGTVDVTDGTLKAGNAYVVGADSALTSTGGETTLSKATVLAGKLTTATTGTTKVTGELILDEAGQLVNSGTTSLNKAAVMAGSGILADGGTLSIKELANAGSITSEAGAKLNITALDNLGSISNGGEMTTGTAVNLSTISNTGTWNATGKTTSTAGTIANDGTLNVSGALTTGTVTGTGTTSVATGGTWSITGQTTQGAITNNGTATISGNGAVTLTGELGGTGTTTILVDATTTGGSTPVITTGTEAATHTTNVKIDISTPTDLLGKTVNFIQVGDTLDGLSQATDFTLEKGTFKDAVYDWATSSINYEIERREQDNLTLTKKLHFTQSEGSADGKTTGMTFTGTTIAKGEIVESYNVADTEAVKAEVVVKEEPKTETKTETDISGNEITIETKTETTITSTVKEEKDTSIGKNDSVVTSAVVGVADQEKSNVILGKNVKAGQNDTGKVQAKMVSIDRIDKDGKVTNLATSGVGLVFSGVVTQEAFGGSEAVLGFEEGSKGAIVKKTEQKIETTTTSGTTQDTKTETIEAEVEEAVTMVDVIQVEKGSHVTLSGDKADKGKHMVVHATHALEVSGTATEKVVINLNKVTMHVGGTEDPDMFETYVDENGKKQKVETKHHITTNSEIKHAEINLTDGTVLSFQQVHDTDSNVWDASAKFEDCVINQTADTKLGSEEAHMDTIQLNNSIVKGTGELRNFKMKGGKLIAGNSPGTKILSSGELEDGQVGVYFITGDSAKWNFSSSNSDYSNTLSIYKVEGPVTLNGVEFFVDYEKLTNGKYEASDTTELNNKFQDGASITLIEGYENLTGTYTFDETTLPTLDEEFEWDTTRLLTTGQIFVVLSEVLEEPTRIANTLVSAGETVLNFGRLAEAQASLREAGTTRTWGSAIAMFDSIDSGATTNGYDYSNWGAAVGVDHAFTKNTVVGVAFGCSWGENEPENGTDHYDAGSIDQDAKMIGIYGVHKFQTKGLLNDVKLSAFAAYGMFENDSTRTNLKNGHKAEAEWDSDAWVLSASLSRDITTDSGVVFTPYVGVEYTTAGMDDFSEQGKSYSADYSADEDYSNLSVKVGVTVSKTYGSFTPYASIAYINDVDRTAGEVTATGRDTITGKSALPGRDAFEIGVGATWQLTENLDVNAGYSAEIRDKATEQNARVGIGYTF